MDIAAKRSQPALGNPIPSRRTLSKSDFKVARTCPAKLYFRKNGFPDRRDGDPFLGLLSRDGYRVEALAKARYPDSVQLSYGRDLAEDFAQTMRALEQENVTLFEATLVAGRRMARVDILEKRGRRVRLIEVKSSVFDGAEHAASLADGKHGVFRAGRKPHGVLVGKRGYLEDIAYQLLLAESLLEGLTIEPWLALLDASKRSGIDDIPSLFEIIEADGRLQTARYVGTREQLDGLDLVSEVNVGAEVDLLREEVEAAAALFEARLDAPLDVHLEGLPRGAWCASCEFRHDPPAERDGFSVCWGERATPKPHALELFSIGSVKGADGRPIIETLFESGRTSLYDVPIDRLTKANGDIGAQSVRQRRQIEYTRRTEAFVDPALGEAIAGLAAPMHFVDFEAARLALPYHTGMRAYGLLAFQ